MSHTVAAPAMMIGIETRERARPQREGTSMPSEAEFATLYQARFSDLAAQLHAYLGDSTEAQDVVQEAFVRAWQRWRKIGEYEDPVAWVRRVAWNLATSRHRNVAVARRFLTRSGRPEHQPAASPDHVALVAALRLIPEQQRRAMVMHYLADLSVADIARDVGVAEGTVKSWLHRGRAELAKHLADDPDSRRPAAQGTWTTRRSPDPDTPRLHVAPQPGEPTATAAPPDTQCGDAEGVRAPDQHDPPDADTCHDTERPYVRCAERGEPR